MTMSLFFSCNIIENVTDKGHPDLGNVRAKSLQQFVEEYPLGLG
jgi:hypothetical protein